MTTISIGIKNVFTGNPATAADHYTMFITGYPPVTIPAGQTIFTFPTLPPGQYLSSIVTYDSNGSILDTQLFPFNIPYQAGLIPIPMSIQVTP